MVTLRSESKATQPENHVLKKYLVIIWLNINYIMVWVLFFQIVIQHPTTSYHLMARSHWRFSQASDFLGSEKIYLDIFTLAIFPSDFYIYFICLFAKIACLNGHSTHLKASNFSRFRKSLKNRQCE